MRQRFIYCDATIRKISDDGRQVSVDVGSSCTIYLPVDVVDTAGLRAGDKVTVTVELGRVDDAGS